MVWVLHNPRKTVKGKPELLGNMETLEIASLTAKTLFDKRPELEAIRATCLDESVVWFRRNEN